MSRCNYCRGDGLVFLRYTESPGYDLASCVCQAGKWYRTKWTLRAFAAQQDPKPVEIGRLEEWFNPEDLAKFRPKEGWHPTPDHPRGM